MMEDKDFRPGDPVTFVTKAGTAERCEVLRVQANNKNHVAVTDGHIEFIVPPNSLYHGHNVQIQMQITGEEKPKRKLTRWVNIQIENNDSLRLSKIRHESEENAINAANRSSCLSGTEYAATGVKIEIPEDMV